METLHPDELLKLWQREDLPTEMAIGQLLQNLSKMQTAIDSNNIALYRLRSDFDSLAEQIRTASSKKRKSK